MNKVYTIIVAILLSLNNFAQSPDKISYQAVIRNSENNLVANQQVGMQISILQGTDANSATSVYSETQIPNTNSNGLVSIEIGTGTSSDNFSVIDWGNGTYFIKTETDLNGGTDYTITGVSQLLSVPFALYANEAGNVPSIEGLSTQQALEDTAIAIRSSIPHIIDGDINNEIQTFSVSKTGDTLFLSKANWIIVPGISMAQPIKDYDGNPYKTVTIGNQEWMAENLKTTHYSNGDPIPEVTDAEWLNLETGAYCNYNNDVSIANIYGKLYNFYVAADNRNVCPIDWHVPSDAEFKVLEDFLGGENIAGGKMKEVGLTHWISPNIDATNDSGFSGLPAGVRWTNQDAEFQQLGSALSLWSTTSDGETLSWSHSLNTNGAYVFIMNDDKKAGFSIRCIKD